MYSQGEAIIYLEFPLNVGYFLPGGCRRTVVCWDFYQDVFLVVVSVNNKEPTLHLVPLVDLKIAFSSFVCLYLHDPWKILLFLTVSTKINNNYAFLLTKTLLFLLRCRYSVVGILAIYLTIIPHYFLPFLFLC